MEKVNLNTTLVRAEEFITGDVSGSMVMMSVENGMYYSLDKVGRSIWQLLESPLSISIICEKLQEQYNIDQATCETEVLALADELIKEKLVKAE